MKKLPRTMWLSAVAIVAAALLSLLPSLLTGHFPWDSESIFAESDWKPWAGMTVHPLYEGQPLITQAPGGDPGGGPSFRGLRLFAPAKNRAFQLEDMDPIVIRLVEKLPKSDALRVKSATSNGRPIYFTRHRLFLASVKPPILILVPTQFDITFLEESNPYDLVNSAYHKIYDKESKLGIRGFPRHAPHWLNYIDLSSTFPSANDIAVVSELWPGPIPLGDAMADRRWPFQIDASPTFPGFLHLSPQLR